MCEYDYRKLLGRIKEKCNTQMDFCKRLSMSRTSLYEKISNRKYFSQKDIEKACTVLEIEIGEIGEYFFNKKVQEEEQNVKEEEHASANNT